MRRLALAVTLFLAPALSYGQDMPLSQVLIEGEGWKNQTGWKFSANTAETIAGHFSVFHKVGGPESWVFFQEVHAPVATPGIRYAGNVAAWPDGATLVVSDSKPAKHLWAFRVSKDGKLEHGERYYALQTKSRQSGIDVGALTADSAGRIYAGTPIGIQVFDPTGRLCGVISSPVANEPLYDVAILPVPNQSGMHLCVRSPSGYFLRKVTAKPIAPLNRARVVLDPQKEAEANLQFARVGIAIGTKGEDTIVTLNRAIELDPKLAEAYDQRGSEHFKLGHIKESIADFDKYLELRPKETPGHWKRGISYYYAGRYEDGKKQFEGYEKVDTNDVENAVWRYLCQAKLAGVEKARADILKIGNDRRVPMMQVYALFAGKAKPEDVLAAANAGDATAEQRNARLFYTHLYLGLYYDAARDKKRTEEHMAKAVEHRIGHYMWDVARVHLELMRTKDKKTGSP